MPQVSVETHTNFQRLFGIFASDYEALSYLESLNLLGKGGLLDWEAIEAANIRKDNQDEGRAYWAIAYLQEEWDY